MKPKISIGSCRRAIGIAGDGLPLMIRGERVLITRDHRTQGKRWVSGDTRLPRASQEELTMKARAIIAEAARPLIPPAPPTISIRECQKAIEIAGASFPSHFGVNRCASPGSQPGISVVGSAEISGLRPKRRNSSPSGRGKSLWTRTKLPNSPFPPQGSPQTAPCESRAYMCPAAKVRSEYPKTIAAVRFIHRRR